MANTPNFNLYKPSRADNLVEVDVSLADNFTKIDTELQNNKGGLDAHINNANAHTSENVTHADGSVKTTLENHEERLTTGEQASADHEGRISSNETELADHETRVSSLETSTTGIDARVTDIETLGIDKLAPNLEGRITTLESDIEGHLAPATFEALSQQNYTFDDLKMGYVDNKLAPIASLLADIATKGTVLSFSHELGIPIEKHLNIFSSANTTSPSIYWCWVIRVDDKITNPLGKYYMFYSTDHADTAGYISMAYSNNLLSGWTNYGQVYKNGAYETETPSVVWDSVNKNFIMYFHSAFSYVGEAQTSWLVTSADGKTWANKQKLLDLNMSELVGDGHNGYFHPFKIGEDFYAYHLMGGGNNARFALSYSEDGYKWYTDHRQLGFGNMYNNRYMSYNHCTPVIFRGSLHLLGVNTNFVSGANPKDAYVAIAPLKSDFRNITGIPKKLFELDGTGESPNVRQVSVYNEDNKLYVFYQCDNNLHCAII